MSVTPHAAQRLNERYRGIVSKRELTELVRKKEYWSHMKLTVSRTLCSAVVKWGVVYFVLNRKRQQVITVLNRKQARGKFEAAKREWPPRRGERVLVYRIQLIDGPDKKNWKFVAVQQPGGDHCYEFSVPNDVELTGDYVLELAWDHAPDPSRVRDILLDSELTELFDA